MGNYNPKNLREIATTRGFQFENMYIAFDGGVYKVAEDERHLIPRKVSTRYTGLKVVAFRGGYVNIARLIATWKALEMPGYLTARQYYGVQIRPKWLNGDKKDCSFVNIEPREDEQAEPKADKIQARIWAIRAMYLSGVTAADIAAKFRVTINYVRTLCAGFDKMSKINKQNLKSICDVEKES